MAMDLDQIEVRQTVDKAGRGNSANPLKVIGVNFINITADKLFRAIGDAIEHLTRILEVMNGSEDEIELVPIFLDPFSARG